MKIGSRSRFDVT
ncbi:hypothetical protein J002_03518 [Cryptococcus neoformans]|nr:hypothetical protein J002_03518 [Cryptococcus neoformans var. grubii]